jgi:hypothetical protein
VESYPNARATVPILELARLEFGKRARDQGVIDSAGVMHQSERGPTSLARVDSDTGGLDPRDAVKGDDLYPAIVYAVRQRHHRDHRGTELETNTSTPERWHGW